jgi:hypothetical protein
MADGDSAGHTFPFAPVQCRRLGPPSAEGRVDVAGAAEGRASLEAASRRQNSAAAPYLARLSTYGL